MEHLALYRSWRPQFFREVIGQEHVCRTLRNAVRLGRVAHAYLFCGPRGTGKTSTARILAKAVNCPNNEDGEPCNNCSACKNTTAGVSLDVIEMDAASHRGIEEIRELNQKVCFAPTAGKSRLFIIDEVHMLTGEAFNALLKTLEEPPRHTIFVLATTEAHKVPLTIMSRCQRFDFRRLGQGVIGEYLRRVAGEEGWQIDDEALELLSQHAGGALRDALGLLEQAASFTGGIITRTDLEALTGATNPEGLRALLTAVMAGDVPSLLQQLDNLFTGGCEPRQVLFQLIDQVREYLFTAAIPGSERTGYASLLRGLAAAEVNLKGNSRPDLVLELALVRFADAQAISATERGARLLADPSGPSGSQAAVARTGTAVATPVAATAAAARPAAAITEPVATDKTRATAGTTEAVVAAGTITGPPASRQQPPAAGDLGNIRKILSRSLQGLPFAVQALGACKLEQDEQRIALKVPNTFQLETLSKDEIRHRLQNALAQYCLTLSLEIAYEAGTIGERSSPTQALPQASPLRGSPQDALPTEPPRDGLEPVASAPGILSEGRQRESSSEIEPPSPDTEREDRRKTQVGETVDIEDGLEPGLFEILAQEAVPVADQDADHNEALPAPEGEQQTEPEQQPESGPAPGHKEQSAAQQYTDHRSDPGQPIDPVGVALTLFNGKIIS